MSILGSSTGPSGHSGLAPKPTRMRPAEAELGCWSRSTPSSRLRIGVRPPARSPAVGESPRPQWTNWRGTGRPCSWRTHPPPLRLRMRADCRQQLGVTDRMAKGVRNGTGPPRPRGDWKGASRRRPPTMHGASGGTRIRLTLQSATSNSASVSADSLTLTFMCHRWSDNTTITPSRRLC